jgi:hypothetical protein
MELQTKITKEFTFKFNEDELIEIFRDLNRYSKTSKTFSGMIHSAIGLPSEEEMKQYVGQIDLKEIEDTKLKLREVILKFAKERKAKFTLNDFATKYPQYRTQTVRAYFSSLKEIKRVDRGEYLWHETKLDPSVEIKDVFEFKIVKSLEEKQDMLININRLLTENKFIPSPHNINKVKLIICKHKYLHYYYDSINKYVSYNKVLALPPGVMNGITNKKTYLAKYGGSE